MATVRSATFQDLPRLAHLWYEKTVVQQQADPRLRLPEGGPAGWSNRAVDWLDDPCFRVLVALLDGHVIGYMVTTVHANEPGSESACVGVVTDMAIDTHGYFPGAGRLLARAACTWLAEQGIEQIRIEVPRVAAVEQAFWRALGAKEWMDCLWMKC